MIWRVFAILLVMLSLAMPVRAQSTGGADAAAIRQFKLELWPRAYAEPNVALLDQLLASEFQSIDAKGAVSTKADELAYVRGKAKDSPDRRFRFDIERLDILPNGTAIVSGTGHVVEPPRDGVHPAFRYRSSNILIKRDGRWQAIASHVSGVLPEEPTSF